MRSAAFAFTSAVALALLAHPLWGQDRKLGTVGLDDRRIASDARFMAVGRLNLDGRGFCSATLVAPSLVLTAAHCLFHKRTRRPLPPDRLHFVAGFRRGKYRAHRRGKAVSVHDDFIPGETSVAMMGHDIALVILESPIDGESIQPIPLDRRTGDIGLAVPLTVVSYARDRAYLPSVERGCVVRSMRERLLFTDCDTNFGASGAPVLTGNGSDLRLLGIVSGVATVKGNLRRTVVVRAHDEMRSPTPR